MIALLGVVTGLLLVGAGWTSAARRSLRCVDGALVPARGSVFPWLTAPLDDPTMPPLSVPAVLCRDINLDSHRELTVQYQAIARSTGGISAPRPAPAPPERFPRVESPPPAPVAAEVGLRTLTGGDLPAPARSIVVLPDTALPEPSERAL